MRQIESSPIANFHGYLDEGKYRFILSRRDLDPDEMISRVSQIQTAAELDLLKLLPAEQQEILPLLYPESLRLPKISEVARILNVNHNKVDRLEQGLFRNLEKLLDQGLRRIK